ncbi:hypothetical protein [Xenorhabdus littoralis]|uniref:hypothetical protein n=1 Tax=Xenorhabdus littoralis TaxID=2582835 RepID=UPI0029E7CF06|nr:hypothetical protein [Xenorhabdus sp. psl]MDX7993090.1 hypothetical protein [Xenorhabdus sp. psl]
MKKILSMCLAATILSGFAVNVANAENAIPITKHAVEFTPTNVESPLHVICIVLAPEQYKFLCEKL